MAGETIRSEAICLAIRPWSRTSHIVSWLTPAGRVVTVVKGAVRPRSAFLGQYDLNYTCEILYYARAKDELRALRACAPLELRERLRGDYRALVFADYCRSLVERLAPQGDDCAAWYRLLESALDAPACDLPELLAFELGVLDLLGQLPEIDGAPGALFLRGERAIPVSPEVADCLRDPRAAAKNRQILLDAARVIGVFYRFHVDLPPDVRRVAVGLIAKTTQGNRA